MRLIKLVHPEFGLCAQKVIFGINTESRVKHNWKHKYGKKFYECIVVVEDDSPVIVLNDKYSFRKKINIAVIEKVLQLVEDKIPVKEICRRVKISQPTVCRIIENKNSNGKPYYDEGMISEIM